MLEPVQNCSAARIGEYKRIICALQRSARVGTNQSDVSLCAISSFVWRLAHKLMPPPVRGLALFCSSVRQAVIRHPNTRVVLLPLLAGFQFPALSPHQNALQSFHIHICTCTPYVYYISTFTGLNKNIKIVVFSSVLVPLRRSASRRLIPLYSATH